jgi:hypothetical protein
MKKNLQPVDIKTGFCCVCYGCGKHISEKEKRWADLNGPAFVAYYCGECTKKEQK